MAWSLNCGCLWKCCPGSKSDQGKPSAVAQAASPTQGKATEMKPLLSQGSTPSDSAISATGASISAADLRQIHSAKTSGFTAQQPQDAKEALRKVVTRINEIDDALGSDAAPNLDAVVVRWRIGISTILESVQRLSTKEQPAYNELLKWLGDILRRHPSLETRLELPVGMADEAKKAKQLVDPASAPLLRQN